MPSCTYACSCSIEYRIEDIELVKEGVLSNRDLEPLALEEALGQIDLEDPYYFSCGCDLVECEEDEEVDEE